MNNEARRIAREFGDIAFHILVDPDADRAFYCIQNMEPDIEHSPARPHWCPRVEPGYDAVLEGYEVYTVQEVLNHQPATTTYPAEIYQLLEDRTRNNPGDPPIWHLMWDPENPRNNTYCLFEWNDNDDNGQPRSHRHTDPHYCPFIEGDRRRVTNGLYRGEETWANWHVVTPAELSNPPAPVRSTHSSWITS